MRVEQEAVSGAPDPISIEQAGATFFTASWRLVVA